MRVFHVGVRLLVVCGLSSSAFAGAPSVADVCQLKPARAKAETIGAYAKRVLVTVPQLAALLASKPSDEALPSLLRNAADQQGVKSCALADRLEVEGLLGQSAEPPAAGVECVVRGRGERSDDLKTALAVKEVLKASGATGHVRFGGCSHSNPERACVRLRLAKADTYASVKAALAKQDLLAAYPVAVKGGVLGAPLEAAKLRAVCDALKKATGSAGARFVEAGKKVDLTDASVELRTFLSTGVNVPEPVFADYAEQGVRDFNFSERCVTP